MRKKVPDLALRVMTAVILVPGLVWIVFEGPSTAFVACLVMVAAIAAFELSRMLLNESKLARVWSVLASSILCWVTVRDPHGALLPTIVLVLIFGGLVVGLVPPKPYARAGYRVAWLIAGPMYVGGLLATLGLLRARPDGSAWVLLAMLIAWLGDTGAYFAGRFLGRHSLAPSISPNKTIEGSLGGLVGSTCGAVFIGSYFLADMSIGVLVSVAIAAGLFGQLGDLAESLLKRSVGSKDSGNVLPGHGGLLDRVDALLFVSPVLWVFNLWML